MEYYTEVQINTITSGNIDESHIANADSEKPDTMEITLYNYIYIKEKLKICYYQPVDVASDYPVTIQIASGYP